MRRVGFARLGQQQPRAWQRWVEVVELDLPAGAGEARCIVTVRQGALNAAGVAAATQESSLTAVPCPAAEAERRAIDFIARRMAAGDVLLQHEGLAALAALAGPDPVAATAQSPAPRGHASAATVADGGAPSPTITALVQRFAPDHWKLLDAARRARSAWRVAERADAATPGADQQALRALVPRLVDLLETGDDLLDHGIAVAIARLGDRGAAEAMRHLRDRGRSPATRRAAHQAWLLLQTPPAQREHADRLLPAWQAELQGDADLLPHVLEARFDERRTHWVPLLADWYDVALVQAVPRARLLALLRLLPLKPGPFQALRYLYKAAEIRRDAEVIGLLHARFENTRPNFYSHGDAAHRQRHQRSAGDRAYSSRTRDYLRLRAWRTLRRLALIGHSHAAELAVQLLLGLVDEDLPGAAQEHGWAYRGIREARWQRQGDGYARVLRHYHPASRWMLVPKLLLARHPGLQVSARATRWWTSTPLDDGTLPPQRCEALPALWDSHPQALLTLALHGRAALVHAVVARALQDHAATVAQQPAPVLQALLNSRFAPTARIGFESVRAQVVQDTSAAAQARWLVLLIGCRAAEARDFAFMHIAARPADFAAQAGLVAALLLSGHERSRRQGEGLALIADAGALVAELQSAMLAADVVMGAETECGTPAAAIALVESLLRAPLAQAAMHAPVEPLLCLLDHASVPVVNLAVSWLLLHQHAAAMLPPTTLLRLLGAADDDRRACGVRLFAALPDAVLRPQQALLFELALHAHAGIRAAVAPALQRVAAAEAGFAEALAQRLHAALFGAEPGEGLHDDALRWLGSFLARHAPARDAAGIWRALQARSRGAQRYGAHALQVLAPQDFSLRQLATLACHAEVAVRTWALRAIDHVLPARPTPEQAEQLLPLSQALFDDARACAQALFGERLPDESLSVELLIAWIDQPQAWMQSLGRSRLVRRMSADEASVCLTRLAQHPSTAVQQFVTQWLLELPRDDAAALARRLRGLQPYFVTVLSQVHRGRTAKTRITAFLRSLTDAPETAAVVAEVFARQVVTCSLTDKPQYIAGLRDIAARHPQIPLPFVAWTPLPCHGAPGPRERLAAARGAAPSAPAAGPLPSLAPET